MIYLISRHDWMIDTTSHLFFWRFELLLQSMSQTQTLVFKNVKWTSDTMTVAFILFWFQDVSAVRLTVKLAVMSLPPSLPPVYTGQHRQPEGSLQSRQSTTGTSPDRIEFNTLNTSLMLTRSSQHLGSNWTCLIGFDSLLWLLTSAVSSRADWTGQGRLHLISLFSSKGPSILYIT